MIRQGWLEDKSFCFPPSRPTLVFSLGGCFVIAKLGNSSFVQWEPTWKLIFKLVQLVELIVCEKYLLSFICQVYFSGLYYPLFYSLVYIQRFCNMHHRWKEEGISSYPPCMTFVCHLSMHFLYWTLFYTCSNMYVLELYKIIFVYIFIYVYHT